MNGAQTIASFIASVIAIITAMIFSVRYLARRFDTWTNNVVENTSAVRDLSQRVTKLEGTIKNGTASNTS